MRLPFQIRRRTLLPILSLVLVWVCFYLVLLASDIQLGGPRAIVSSGNGHSQSGATIVYPDLTTMVESDDDPLQRPFERFFVPDLHISRLATILAAQAVDLALEYPPDLKDANLDAEYAEPVTAAEILQAIAAPHGYGFLRQGRTIRMVPLESRNEKRRQPGDDTEPERLIEARKVKADILARGGEPFDLWLSARPPLRLRILAQPLHTEFEDVAQSVGIVVAALRGNEVWFRHQFETRLGQTGRIDVRADESMWCLVTPVREEGEEIRLGVEMYYESYVASN